MAGNRGMENLIHVVNKLQDTFTKLGISCSINLPQIAVIGGQSAGKSSVLENFVGRDFLPRGSGIVTRRPLVLQLNQSDEEYGEFLHRPGRKYKDFDKIREEITNETHRVTGANKGISSLPINLKIFSPKVLNLTLIDLPGMTRVPVGDQPEDIEEQLKEMILSFVMNENCLILAVTAANQDIATSDALKLAKKVDPEGQRTIGVITKLDLMDKGTDAHDILTNRVLPLHRGYVGVVNRSQKNIEDKKVISEALEAERNFFATHPAYRMMAERMGTPHLQRLLNRQLAQHIRDIFPDMREELHKQMQTMEMDVRYYNSYHLQDPTRKTKAMMQMIYQLQTDFEHDIEGSGTVCPTEIIAGALIYDIFHVNFPSEIDKFKLEENQLRDNIAVALKNSLGIRSGLFIPNAAFQSVVKEEVQKLKEPSIRCVDKVVDQLMALLMKCTEKMKKFPNLQKEITNLIKKYIRESSLRSKKHVKFFVQYQAGYININHKDFTGITETAGKELPHLSYAFRALAAKSFLPGGLMSPSRGDAKEELPISLAKQVQTVQDLVGSYMAIVVDAFKDMVPKIIMNMAVTRTLNLINTDLIASLYTEDTANLMAESQEEARKREELFKLYKACTEALNIIEEVSTELYREEDGLLL